MMKNSVSAPRFNLGALGGQTRGAIDAFDYVDGYQGSVQHVRATRVPRGAPIIAGGWALEPDRCAAPRAVTVVLDGVRPYETEVALDRADVALASGGEFPSLTGFRVAVPTEGLLPGGHELRAYVAAADGLWYQAGYQPFWLYDTPRSGRAPHERAIHIRPEPVATLTPAGILSGVGDPVPRGWFALVGGCAIDPRTRRAPSGVAAYDAAGGSWSAPCDIMRPDVRAALNAHDDRLGFELAIATDALERGRHRLRLVAYDDEGVSYANAAEVELDVGGAVMHFPVFAREREQVPRAAVAFRIIDDDAARPGWSWIDQLDTAVARGTVLQVEGWALTGTGAAASEVFVELSVPVVAVTPHRYPAVAGYRRDVQPSILPSSPLADAWFHCRVDTSHLAPRSYDIGLAVVEAGRSQFARRALGTLTILDFDRA